jgi:uncharacterized protein YndB with AHSA1/START domain
MNEPSNHSASAADAEAPAKPSQAGGPANAGAPTTEAGMAGAGQSLAPPAPGTVAATAGPTTGEAPARQYETVVEIAAPAAAVWRALTEAEDLMRWFAPQARVTPGAGGQIWMSWGGAAEGSSRIEIWEPEKRLRALREGGDSAAPQVAVDYFIEAAAGGRTVLRLVQSGFGAGAEWDDEFEGSRRGWPIFFACLKHDLERHRGEPCRRTNWCGSVALTAAAAWELLMGPRGLDAESTLAGLAAGSPYRLRTPLGEDLAGTVLRLTAPGHALLTVEPLHDALLSIFCDAFGEQTFVTVGWTLYGPAAARAEDLRGRWSDFLGALFTA